MNRSLKFIFQTMKRRWVSSMSAHCFYSKARVPIGLTAANKQAPLLMHVDYRVMLPDHDWVVAERHKLIPSVYGIMKIKSKLMGKPEAVTYSGPTFIAVRSGKHCSSTAASHGRDLDCLISDETFFDVTRNSNSDVKPIFIFVVDGGPDENPRLFILLYCLECFNLATN